MNWVRKIFKIETEPVKGLFAFEWVVVAYTLLTLLFIAFYNAELPRMQALVVGRGRIIAMLVALWGVYRLAPCRATRLARVVGQMALLAWWYPDTYELNRILPNFDHLFARADQIFFGYQPALFFSQRMPQHWFSELMDLGYASYFPMIVIIVLYYFFFRYKDFTRMAFILLTSFFIFYVIFILLPVTGPQYYYPAIGLDNIVRGAFPSVGDYFCQHAERVVSPGWKEGFFYRLVEGAHQAGERPTAAFPSSHVGIAVIILLLARRGHPRRQWLFWVLLPFAVLLFFSTVYIQAHYAVDVFAGLVAGVLFYFVLLRLSNIAKP